MNYPKQAVVKRKATSEHAKLSEGLPPKEDLSLSLNLEEEVAMKTVKLGPMRLKLSGVSELAESSTRLPPMGEVGPFEVLEQGSRETVGKTKPSVVNQEDSDLGKLECGQGSDITLCHWDVQMSRTTRVKKRWKPRQKLRRKGKAKASRRDRGESRSFGPRELARFKELLEKPVKLKPGWPDDEDMAT
ncbi:hypothetical protein J1N35_044497 [Gossypium stocksii]|uniref:Uncharacterized protein n=1 Tax=Gossypium stocksii TaxID=47602 RepID=A0A9D3U990_9ROSI|nr:hypothetical protein J1N35_044497 [Gossypium stocksii]